MENITTIYELAKQLGLIDAFFDIYGKYIWTAGLILALLNCLFGYKLRKLWGVLFGFLVGAAAGLGLAFYLKQSGKVALVAALAIGIFFALLAFLLYRLGLFFLCAGLSAFFLWQLLPFHTGPALIVYLVIGAVVGVLALAKERLTVSLATSIGGAWGTAWFFSQLTGHHQLILLIFITIALSLLGIMLQLKPWKDRKYWNSEDEKNRQELKEQRERRAQKKKAKRKKARQNRKRKRKDRKENRRQDQREEKRQDNRRGKSSRRQNQQPSGQNKPADARSDFSVHSDSAARSDYDARFDHDTNIDSAAHKSHAGYADSSAHADFPERSDAAASEGTPAPTSGAFPESNPLDFSDVRSQLSQEVAEIYQKQQEESKE